MFTSLKHLYISCPHVTPNKDQFLLVCLSVTPKPSMFINVCPYVTSNIFGVLNACLSVTPKQIMSVLDVTPDNMKKNCQSFCYTRPKKSVSGSGEM